MHDGGVGMIDEAYLKEIGLDDAQAVLVMDRITKASRYREILLQAGVSPKCVEKIIRVTDPAEVDLSNESLLREKIRSEWSGMIPSEPERPCVRLTHI